MKSHLSKNQAKHSQDRAHLQTNKVPSYFIPCPPPQIPDHSARIFREGAKQKTMKFNILGQAPLPKRISVGHREQYLMTKAVNRNSRLQLLRRCCSLSIWQYLGWEKKKGPFKSGTTTTKPLTAPQ